MREIGGATRVFKLTTIHLTSEAAANIPTEALREFLESHGCRAREVARGEIKVDVPAERPVYSAGDQ